MSYMDRLKARVSEIRIPDELPKLTEPGFGSFGSDPDRGISRKSSPVSTFPPAEIARGMAALRAMSVPHGLDRAAWRCVVDDAGRLIAEGWAEEALALGWTAIDLFGCEPLGSDDDYRNGLSAWLQGRPLVLLDADSAIVRVDERRSIFNRKRDRAGTVLLWEMGQ